MATHDYSEDLATAIELATEFGSTITVQKLSPTPPDGSKPWRGPNTPDSPPAATASPLGVQINIQNNYDFGNTTTKKDLNKDATCAFILIPPVGEANDYTTFDQMVVGGVIWDIVTITKLQPDPSGLIVAYYVEVG